MRNLVNASDLVDGILTVGEPALNQCRSLLPKFPAERLGLLPVPVANPEHPVTHPPLSGRPIVIGYSGRLVRALKRIDRLVQVCKLLDQNEQPYRLEILGEGKDGSWLRKRLRGNPRVIFHGYRTGKAYWDILGTWDVILYVSDTEGFGISLLEAMKCGAIPLYPDIGGGAEPYVAQVRASLLYPAGDMDSLARELARLYSAPDGELHELRQRCRDIAGHNDTDGYHLAFANFARIIEVMPRRSTEPPPRRKLSLANVIPFGLLRRLFPNTIS
jgi:glycosyltransferase involved in cell wall biosynthesis